MTRIRSSVAGWLFALIASGGSLGASAQPVPAAVSSELAPSGTLRAAINYNNPLLARRDAVSGELSGVAVDLSRELARRLGVPVELIPYESAGKISGAAKGGEWDVAYLAIDPARAGDIDFSAAYLELEGTYLVPQGSPLQSIEQVDQPGIRIAVTAKSAYDLYLGRELKHAQLVHAETTPLSIDMMLAQKLDAVAAVRTALITGARRVPGSRVLDGHFMTIPQAAGVPAGRPLAAAYLRQFIEEMKATGFVAQALARHGLGADDAVVAQPAPLPVEHSVQVATYLDVLASHAEAGRALAAQYVRETRGAAGNLECTALEELGRDNHLVIIEAWKSQADFEQHEHALQTQHSREQLAAIERSPYDERINHSFENEATQTAAGAHALYVVTHVDVPGNQRERLEALLRAWAAPSRHAPGHVRFEVYQQDEPRTNHFTLYSIWSSRQAFEAYGSSDYNQQFMNALAPLLGAPYDERLYRLLTH